MESLPDDEYKILASICEDIDAFVNLAYQLTPNDRFDPVPAQRALWSLVQKGLVFVVEHCEREKRERRLTSAEAEAAIFDPANWPPPHAWDDDSDDGKYVRADVTDAAFALWERERRDRGYDPWESE